MERRDNISQDPFPHENNTLLVCMACGSDDPRLPSFELLLTPTQLQSRASIDTGGLETLFRQLDCSVENEVLLCTECRHKRYSWHIISNLQKCRLLITHSALQTWKSRCNLVSFYETHRNKTNALLHTFSTLLKIQQKCSTDAR